MKAVLSRNRPSAGDFWSLNACVCWLKSVTDSAVMIMKPRHEDVFWGFQLSTRLSRFIVGGGDAVPFVGAISTVTCKNEPTGLAMSVCACVTTLESLDGFMNADNGTFYSNLSTFSNLVTIGQ